MERFFVYTSVIYTSVSEINPIVWDSVISKDKPYLTHAYLASMESSISDNYYCLVFDCDGPVACACFYFVETDLGLFLPEGHPVYKFLKFIRKSLPRFLKVNILECGPPGMSGQGIVFREGLTISKRRQVLDGIITELETLGKKLRPTMTVIRDFKVGEFEELSSFGFKAIPNLEEAEMDLVWDSFDSYVNSFKSHYRSIVKKEIAKNSCIRVEKTSNFEQHSAKMADLWYQTSSKSNEYRREVLKPDYFYKLSSLGDKVRAVLLWREDTLVAFSLSLLGESTSYAMWMGADYSLNTSLPLVFGVYYETIKEAIEQKKQRLFLGETTYGLKLRVGATLIPINMYLKCRYPWITRFLAFIAKKTTPQQKVLKKNVFKLT